MRLDVELHSLMSAKAAGGASMSAHRPAAAPNAARRLDMNLGKTGIGRSVELMGLGMLRWELLASTGGHTHTCLRHESGGIRKVSQDCKLSSASVP